jgi:hypothetical protein
MIGMTTPTFIGFIVMVTPAGINLFFKGKVALDAPVTQFLLPEYMALGTVSGSFQMSVIFGQFTRGELSP